MPANQVANAIKSPQREVGELLIEQPPDARHPTCLPEPAAPASELPAPAVPDAPAVAPAVLEQSSRGVKPAFAQSLPNISD